MSGQLGRVGVTWSAFCKHTKLSHATLHRLKKTGECPTRMPATGRIAEYFGVTWTDILAAWREDRDIPVGREETLEELLPEHVIASAKSHTHDSYVPLDVYIQAAILFFETTPVATRRVACGYALAGVTRLKPKSPPHETELEPYT
jgi:hypothetical protein